MRRKMSALGLLIIRLVFGLTMAGHGAQKLFGWFGGYGLTGTGAWLDTIGMRPGKTLAALAGLAELVGGLLLALGVWTPVAAALITAVMLVAIAKVHAGHGYWTHTGGYEYNLAIIAAAIGLALTGPGSYTILSLLR